MQVFNRLRVNARIGMFVAYCAVTTAAVDFATIYVIHHRLVSDRVNDIAHVVQIAQTTVELWYDKEGAGILNRTEAQREAQVELRRLADSYGHHFFVRQYDGLTLVDPDQHELEGQNLWSWRDFDGSPVVRSEIEVARDAGGPVYYRVFRKGDRNAVKHMAYVSAFAPWQWIVGMSVEIDDIQRETHRIIVLFGGVSLGVIILVVGVGWAIGPNLNASLDRLSIEMEKLTKGDLTVAISETERADEIGELARAMEVMRQQETRRRMREVQVRRPIMSAVLSAGAKILPFRARQ